MLYHARNIASTVDYNTRLQELRANYLSQAAGGQPVAAAYWTDGERAALEHIKNNYFTLQARSNFMPLEKARAVSDEQDFEQRETKVDEYISLEMHRLLVAMPWVGQPGFEDAPLAEATAFIKRKGETTAFVKRKGETTAFIRRKGGTTAFIKRKGGTTAFIKRKGETTAFVKRKGAADKK
jgi:hypothetical protein